jgi:putative ABC transport system permease protein
VRSADLVGLALSALWQQKARTLLTTLGVVFGSFVLVASLSVGQGVRDTIMRESRRSDYLRRVEVRPGWGRRQEDVPPEETPVRGEMSDAKRERIRRALASRRANYNAEPAVPLAPERLRSLAQIEHVEAVVPSVLLDSWATLDGRTERGVAWSVRPDDPVMARRVVAGRFLETPDERAAVVSEFLLYQWGLTDDAAVNAVVGKTLRLEVRAERQAAGLEMYLLKPNRAEKTRDEASALDKVKEQLPRQLDQFDLTPAERGALGQALRQSSAPRVDFYTADLPIVGVLRLAEREELERSWGWDTGGTPVWDTGGAAVLLPVRTAEGLFFRVPSQRERGLNEATLIVDREENVEGVLRQVRAMGLNPHAPLEFIQRERLLYTLIFGAMTCVAGVALLVAALGIANTMLMSVLERTREVGVMKAVGAADRHVQAIFLLEGALIGLFGGGVGLLLGWAASFPGDAWVRGMVSRDLKIELKGSLFVFPPWLVLAVVLFAVLVTTLAAVYPARRAAKVNPVTALRHE